MVRLCIDLGHRKNLAPNIKLKLSAARSIPSANWTWHPVTQLVCATAADVSEQPERPGRLTWFYVGDAPPSINSLEPSNGL